MAAVKSFSFDWKSILAQSDIFHTSGVTAGLSSVLTEEVRKAMTTAHEMKQLVSYDFNYRKNIWSIEEFVQRQKDLIPLIDILFCAESDLELFFKKNPASPDYSDIFKATKLKFLVINQRSADETQYGIKIVTKDNVYPSKMYTVQCLDRIGVGDSMAAGFLAAWLKTQDIQTASEWGALAGALKYGILGDMALLKESELKSIFHHGPKAIIR
jgi:2-dehydro-3-deoxygluconokinase